MNENSEPLRRSLASLENDANNAIRRYALITAATSLIPLPNPIGMVIDSPIQLSMITNLAGIYGIKHSGDAVRNFLAVILDNFSIPTITKVVLEFSKGIPIVGPVMGSIASALMTFSYTYAMGLIFKQVYRDAYQSGGQPDFSNIPHLVTQAWTEAWSYTKNNWQEIIFKEKYVLHKYEVDLSKLQNEMIASVRADEILKKMSEKFWGEIQKDIVERAYVTEELFAQLQKIADEIGCPSDDLIEAMLLLDGINDVTVKQLNESLTKTNLLNPATKKD